jgi:tetratricopeptide (TPR) repeat protein
MYVSLLVKLRNNNDAINILVNRSYSDNTTPFAYLDYLTGECKLNRLDMDASNWFHNYHKNSPTENYIKTAWQKLAWNALLRGDSIAYNYYISNAVNKGNQKSESDKQAYREAVNNTIPDINLLKARLLFDGGYYPQAAAILENINPENQYHEFSKQMEHYYRLGRISQESGDFEKAEKNYLIVIRHGRHLPQFYAANSALQLGFMYEKRGQTSRAIQYYKECLNINPEEYKTGIHQKAKAGINRLQ